MMTFKISTVERTAAAGVIKVAHWRVSKELDGFTAGSYGSIALNQDQEVPTVPFEQVTEEMVVAWVQEAMGSEQVASLEASLDTQLEDLKNPKILYGVPWSTTLPADGEGGAPA